MSNPRLTLALASQHLSVSDQALAQLAESCQGLRAIKTKPRETKRNYAALYLDRMTFFKELVAEVDRAVRELYFLTGQRKADVEEKVVKVLRQRQESLGLDSYLINPAKFAMIKSVVRWNRQFPPRTAQSSSYSSPSPSPVHV